MPVKRTDAKQRRWFKITPEAVEAFRRNDYGALHDALGLKPWETSPLWADRDEPGWGEGTAGNITWAQARELRAELIADRKGQRHS